jgi:long-chain acyl-CoA synthetase
VSTWELLRTGLERASVVGSSGEASGAKLAPAVDGIAAGLRDAGVKPRHAVGVALRQDVDFALALFAAWSVGAVPVPIDARLPPTEIARTLQRASAAFAITAADPGCVWGHLDGGKLSAHGTASGPQRPGDESLLLVTSGTSGLPKLASVPERATRAICQRFPLGPDQVFLAALPLAHAFGLFVALLAPVSRGAKVAITEWTTPDEVIAFGSKHRATVMPAVPRMVTQLLRANLADLGTIRALVVGGAAAPAEELLALRQRYEVLVGYGYGMTETGAMTTLNLHLDEKPGSVGRAFPGVEIRIAGDKGRSLPPGEIGEVWLRDTALVAGYTGGERLPLKAGWLRTGDLGSLDEEGYLYLAGRAKEVVITSGFNVAPAEVEEVLASHPGVEEAAVVGMPHAELGEEVVAFVVTSSQSEVDPEQLRAYARERLAGYKVPRAFRFVAELPRTTTGKVAKWRLKEEIGVSDVR